MIFSIFSFEIHCWGVPEAKNAVQPNSYSKGRVASHSEFSMTRSIEVHRSDTWKVSQIDGISTIWYPKNKPLVPEKLVIIQFYCPCGIKLGNEHINTRCDRKVSGLRFKKENRFCDLQTVDGSLKREACWTNGQSFSTVRQL